jgi:hypothetical protein
MLPLLITCVAADTTAGVSPYNAETLPQSTELHWNQPGWKLAGFAGAKLRLGEDSQTELKRLVWRGHGKVAEPHPDGLSDELAAMANAEGGMLVLGIDDRTREVLGIAAEDLDAAERWLVSICTDRIVLPLNVNTVLVVSVPRSLWVHQSANGYFRRVFRQAQLAQNVQRARSDSERPRVHRGLGVALQHYRLQTLPGQQKPGRQAHCSRTDHHHVKYRHLRSSSQREPVQFARWGDREALERV